MDFTPAILAKVDLPDGWIELVEWGWPHMIDFQLTETNLMLEMSLPPYATDASVEFPDIDSGNHCFVGTLFVRYPGIDLHGRAEGGRIRVLRFVFTGALAQRVLGEVSAPPLSMLQGLLDIRSDSLRKVMGLALREMTTREDRSAEALAALQTLAAVELRRLLERQLHASRNGRLTAWQYRRIRMRIGEGGKAPTATELAALCGISVRHLSRQFHALTGNTLGNYMENARIEQAKQLLVSSDTPIKNVAFATGFSHPNSFARAFRRATGASPHQFRQRSGGTEVLPAK